MDIKTVRVVRARTMALPLVIAITALMSVPLLAQTAPPAAGLPAAWQEGSWTPGPEKYGVEIDVDVPVRMSDGVVLKASIAYPTDLATGKRAVGQFPVLLEQSPYNQGISQDGDPKLILRIVTQYFVTRGYIYVFAEVRGTHHSGGQFGFFSERENKDGVELVNWAAHQLAGSNGRIGLTGCSYTGLNQYFTAAMVGKNSLVKAIAPAGVGPDMYRALFFTGGTLTVTGDKVFTEALANLGTESAVKFTLDTLADIKSGGPTAYDGDFWKARTATNLIQTIVDNGIPALILAAWNDYPTSPGEAYAMFQNAYARRDVWAPMSSDQEVTGRYQLMMDNGAHCSGRGNGPKATATLKWFDAWLKDVDTSIGDARKTLHLYELGSNKWVSSGVYPQVEHYQTLYLHSGGALSPTKAPEGEAGEHLIYASPAHPGATLTYTSAPYPDGAVLAGPVAATIYAKPSSTNVLIIADLFDVAPDGKAQQLSTGGQVGSLRALDEAKSWRDKDGRLTRPYHTFTRDEPVKPGEVVRLDIQMQPRQAALAPGHSLRLVLKTQSDPKPCGTLFPGGGSFWCVDPTVPQRRALEGSSYEVEHNGAWPSLINVPVQSRNTGE